MRHKVVHHSVLMRRLAFATACIIAFLAPLASSSAQADVDAGDSMWIGRAAGYGGTSLFPVYTQIPADPENPGDPDYWAYCIEHAVSARVNTSGNVEDLSRYLGDNFFTDPAIQQKVLWVLAHSYPAVNLVDFGAAVGAPGISENDAIEATQYALWRYTDLDWDADWRWETDNSKAAYWSLVDGANASPGFMPSDIEVTVSLTSPALPGAAGSLVGPFVVSTNQSTVHASVAPGATLTNALGNVIDATAVVDGQELYLDLRGTTTSGSATLSVSAPQTGPTGHLISVPTATVDVPTRSDHAQTIILVAASGTKKAASAVVTWAGSTTDSASEIGTQAQLADTGASSLVPGLALLGFLVALGGGAMVIAARRTRA